MDELRPILESKSMRAIFQEKGKKVKKCLKGQNIWKLRQKWTKFENILNKCIWALTQKLGHFIKREQRTTDCNICHIYATINVSKGQQTTHS